MSNVTINVTTDTKNADPVVTTTAAAELKADGQTAEDVTRPTKFKAAMSAGLTLEPGSRTIISRISTTLPDRDGDVMIPKGMDLKRYRAHPVVLWSHNYKELPVGRNVWPIKVSDTELIAKTELLPEGKSERADAIYEYLDAGFTLGVSIGFDVKPDGARRPTEKDFRAHPEWAGAQWIIEKWELLEYSFGTLPINRQALTLAVSKGILSPATLNQLDMETPEPPRPIGNIHVEKRIVVPVVVVPEQVILQKSLTLREIEGTVEESTVESIDIVRRELRQICGIVG